MHHNSPTPPSPTISQTGVMVNRNRLRVHHAGYSPHTTPHNSPNVVYTPTTTQQNVFQFHEGMHHTVEDVSSQQTNVPLHSPNVPALCPNNVATASPNISLQSPNLPLQSPNVPQSPGHRYMHQQRFNFPPTGDALQIKTETPSSPFPTYQDASQSSPAPQHAPLRYTSQNTNTEAMLSAINSYTESDLLRDGFDVPSSTSGISDSLMTSIASQPNNSVRARGSEYNIFEAETALADTYMDRARMNIQSEPFVSEPSCTISINATKSRGAIGSDSATLSTSDAKLPTVAGLTSATAKTRGVGRGRGSKQSGHRPNLVCQICGKKFNNSSAIAKHKLTHSDERKYACSICSKAFKRQDHLNGHMLTHRDKKPYECKFENCDKSYSDARSLRRHLENHHSVVEQTQTYSQRMSQYGHCSYQAGQSGGQYFQFDSRAHSYQDGSSENWRQFRSGERSPGYQQLSPISPAPGGNPTSPLHGQPPARTSWALFDDEPKTVECSLCHRRFKNVPALNGHMRLHGGYFKKDDKETKADDKQEELNKESMDSGQMLPPVQATFCQKPRTSFQKPAPLDQVKRIGQDVTTSSYDDEVMRLRKLGLVKGRQEDVTGSQVPVSKNSQVGLSHMSYVGQGPILNPAVANQEFLDESRPVTAAMTLAGMSSMNHVPMSTQDIQHGREEAAAPSILERRLLGYTDYSETEHQLSIKSPTTGTLFSFPERPPSQNANPGSADSERKRHLSADADKFTGPKRLDDFEMEYEKRPYSRTMEDTVFSRPKEPVADIRVRRDDILSRSCPSGALFRNPRQSTCNVVGRRRKPRPEPLFIPPHVNHFGYHSRLRSPRLWDKDIGCTPPPYTPPPMLSPARKGCGLFWMVQPYRPVTPKSAPVTPKLVPVRLASTSEETDVPSDAEGEQPPATDIKPHVNVGAQYQADIPDYNEPISIAELKAKVEKEDLVWCPSSIGDNSSEEIQCYMDFACCAALPGSGTNKEYAIHLLHYAHGNIQTALTLLMMDQPQFPEGHVLSSYKYDETDLWSTMDIDAFHNALLKCDKDFYSIGRECLKSTKQCIEFYYLWKKVCPEEYKRLRVLRRKREQEELYNLRSRGEDSQLDAGNQMAESLSCVVEECKAVFSTREALIEHERVHLPNTPSPTSMDGTQVPSPCDGFVGDDFPCKVCGKIFFKVKSRNAHMKRHRAAEESKPFLK